MQNLLQSFKEDFHEQLLTILWRQWSSLGVAGSLRSSDSWIVDPEALLLLTCTVGRHDARLFDEVLDWCTLNGSLLSVQRLKRMLKQEEFQGGRTLSAVGAFLSRGSVALKWKSLARDPLPEPSEPMFILKDGRPLPVLREKDPLFAKYGLERGLPQLRGYSQRFSPTVVPTLLLQLRALFGVNTRSDIFAYLLTRGEAHPSQVARETYYSRRAIQDTMVEMAQSGVVRRKSKGREKHYWMQQDAWAQLLDRPERIPEWVTWPPVFRALEEIWMALHSEALNRSDDPLIVASKLRRLMMQIRPRLDRTLFGQLLSDDRPHLGASYLPVFTSDIENLLQGLNA